MEADFEQLYKLYYMQVFSYAMTLAKNKNTAEELTQKTFFKILTAGKGYKGLSSELTWILAITKNLYIDECRKDARNAGITIEQQSDTNIENMIDDEDSSFRIYQVLHELEEPYKEVFQLRVFGELSFLKISKVFGKSENWARVTYYRARVKIKERLDEQ